MIQNIDDLKEPPIIDNYYLVPCIIFERRIPEDNWEDFKEKIVVKIPIINIPHTDKETGQHELHYHVDTRFLNRDKLKELYIAHKETINVNFYRITQFNKQLDIIYLKLKCIKVNVEYITPSDFIINKVKLKHKCIYKGRCPHRGANLQQVTPIDGIITCPLHGLKFEEYSKQLII